MAAVFVPNPAGLREMLATPAMVKAIGHCGELVRIRAEEIAPVRSGSYAFGTDPDGQTGGSFELDVSIRDGVATARISNNVRAKPTAKYERGFAYGVSLEFGNKRIKKQRILGRALDVLSRLP